MVCALFKNLALTMNNSKNLVPAIIIMAKVPCEGSVKTRLRPFLTDAQCAELAVCFLRDTFTKAAKITTNLIVALTPNDGAKELEKLLPKGAIFVTQTGKNLGERMTSAFAFAEAKGFSPLVMIGTDSPNFPSENFAETLDLFKNPQTEIVLGATTDGGYYLVALRRAAAEIFENVGWSSPKTFAQTAENARFFFGAKPSKISAWYDVDTPDDLKKLFDDYSRNKNFTETAPETARWLENNRKLFEG